MPFFQTFSPESAQPGTFRAASSERRCSTGQPASTRAPRVMSPLMPEKQSKYASFMEKPPNGGTSSRNCHSVGFKLILSAQACTVKRPLCVALFDPRRGHLLYWRDSNHVLAHLEDMCIR